MACQRAAASAAQVYGAATVEGASAGEVEQAGDGGVVAPVTLRISYPLADGGTQVRQATVSCSVNGDGVVTALV